MRHRKIRGKLGRTGAHRAALMASLARNLIERKRIRTTLPKAKAVRQVVEKLVTLARKGSLAARRLARARLRSEDCVGILFRDIVPQIGARQGGYTRITKLGQRYSDNAEMAVLEWMDVRAAVRQKREKKGKGGEEKKGG